MGWGRQGLFVMGGFTPAAAQVHIPKPWVRLQWVTPAFPEHLVWNPQSCPCPACSGLHPSAEGPLCCLLCSFSSWHSPGGFPG